MNGIDIAVVAVCLISSLIGILWGLLASLFSTAGWFLAIVGNHYLFDTIEAFLDERFQSKIITFLIGYVGGLVLLLFIFSVINFVFLSTVKRFRAGFIDRSLGGVFGFVRGLLLVTVIFSCFDLGISAISGEKIRQNSLPEVLLNARSLPLMKKGELILVEYLPDDLKKKIADDQVQIPTSISVVALVNKLSSKVPKSKLEEINNLIKRKNLSEEQILPTKIKELWRYYDDHKGEKLSEDEKKTIKSIINS